MNRNYIKLFSILLLVTPSMFLGMQKPAASPIRVEAGEEEITPVVRIANEEFQESDVDWSEAIRRQEQMFGMFSNTAEGQAALRTTLEVFAMLATHSEEEIDSLSQNRRVEAIREQARRAVRITPSIEEIVEETPVAIVNSVRAQVLAEVPAATPNPTRTERLQAYWNNLHPAVKAGVVGIGAVATCSAAKKLYDLVNKRK